jgi:hypothetical protein
MSARSRPSKQSSQRDPCSNADTPLTKGMSSSGRSASLGDIELQTASTVEREPYDANSKPSFVEWEAQENANCPTTGDRTTAAGVVADKLFQKAKLVDRNFDLGYDVTEGSICKFVTTYCNLQANIDVGTWWKEARKWIPTYISCLRNDKSMTMKWAFLGTHVLLCVCCGVQIKAWLTGMISFDA